jgi:hypothetical protein
MLVRCVSSLCGTVGIMVNRTSMKPALLACMLHQVHNMHVFHTTVMCCLAAGTCDMREQNIFEAVASKKSQLFLATQVGVAFKKPIINANGPWNLKHTCICSTPSFHALAASIAWLLGFLHLSCAVCNQAASLLGGPLYPPLHMQRC